MTPSIKGTERYHVIEWLIDALDPHVVDIPQRRLYPASGDDGVSFGIATDDGEVVWVVVTVADIEVEVLDDDPGGPVSPEGK